VLVDGSRILVADTRNDALRAIDAAGNVTTVVRSQPGNAFDAMRRPVSLARKRHGLLVMGTLTGEMLEIDGINPLLLDLKDLRDTVAPRHRRHRGA